MAPTVIGEWAKRLAGRLADFAFPRICPVCGELSDRPGRQLCWSCMGSFLRVQIAPPQCGICGMPLKAEPCDGMCRECRTRRPAFDMARSALHYEGAQRRLVHLFKYGKGTWLLNDLCDILEATARTSFDFRQIDAILPVPLHSAKFIIRSYNQAGLLARELARRTERPFAGRLLVRRRDTPTQTRLGPKLRAKNVSRAFGVEFPEAVRSRTLLVIDDVATTGSTLSEIASTLKKAGAWRVWALTLCRAGEEIPKSPVS